MKERPILFSGPMVRALLAGRKTQTRRVMKPQPPTEQQFRGSTFGLDRAVADGVKMYSQNDYDRLPKHPTDFELTGSVGVARNAGFPRRYRCPYGGPGDRLWVKETWSDVNLMGGPGIAYRANGDVRDLMEDESFLDGRGAFDYDDPRLNFGQKGLRFCVWSSDLIDGLEGSWRPSIHMPRWASRLTLEVTDVRVERLQAISEADAEAEGVQEPSLVPLLGAFWSSRDSYARLWEHINGKGSWAANPWVWAVTFPPVTEGRT